MLHANCGARLLVNEQKKRLSYKVLNPQKIIFGLNKIIFQIYKFFRLTDSDDKIYYPTTIITKIPLIILCRMIGN